MIAHDDDVGDDNYDNVADNSDDDDDVDEGDDTSHDPGIVYRTCNLLEK